MLKTTRTRTMSAAVAAGTLALALSGCGALFGGGTKTTEAETTAVAETSTAAEETSEAAEETSEAAEESSEPTESASEALEETTEDASEGTGQGSSSLKGVDATAFTEAQQKEGVTNFIKFMQTAIDGDWDTACTLIGTEDGGEIKVVKGEAEKKMCAAAASSQMGSDDLSGARDLFTEENVTLKDNGDGTANVLFMGNNMNIRVVKTVDNGVLVLV